MLVVGVGLQDGSSGYVAATSLSLSPAELKEEIDKDSNVHMAREFFKRHPPPPTLKRNKSWAVGKLQLTITGSDRCRLIGKKDSSSWAESEQDNSFLIVYYNVRNLSKELQDLPENVIWRSDTGELCRLSDLGCGALWDSKHMNQFEQIKPGRTLRFADVFHVPDSIQDGQLKLLVADTNSVDHLYPAQVSLLK